MTITKSGTSNFADSTRLRAFPPSCLVTRHRYFSNPRATGYNNTDLAVQKWFNVAERFRVRFQTQMFNFVNHANFDSPDIGWGDTNFGQTTNSQGPRQVQFALKITC